MSSPRSFTWPSRCPSRSASEAGPATSRCRDRRSPAPRGSALHREAAQQDEAAASSSSPRICTQPAEAGQRESLQRELAERHSRAGEAAHASISRLAAGERRRIQSSRRREIAAVPHGLPGPGDRFIMHAGGYRVKRLVLSWPVARSAGAARRAGLSVEADHFHHPVRRGRRLRPVRAQRRRARVEVPQQPADRRGEPDRRLRRDRRHGGEERGARRLHAARRPHRHARDPPGSRIEAAVQVERVHDAIAYRAQPVRLLRQGRFAVQGPPPDLVAAIRASPGKLNFSTAGIGTSQNWRRSTS